MNKMSKKYKQRNTAVAEYQCQKSINTFTLVTSQGWSVTNSRMQTLCFRKKLSVINLYIWQLL